MSESRAFCAFCHCVKDTEKGVFLVLWPNGKAICNNCIPGLKKRMDAPTTNGNEVA